MGEHNKDLFFKENFEGIGQGGYFVRNDLFKFMAKLKEKGLTPVGILIDNSWNLEVIVADNKGNNEDE
jgi:hypothetical protein